MLFRDDLSYDGLLRYLCANFLGIFATNFGTA